jgi:hypothetical protein
MKDMLPYTSILTLVRSNPAAVDHRTEPVDEAEKPLIILVPSRREQSCSGSDAGSMRGVDGSGKSGGGTSRIDGRSQSDPVGAFELRKFQIAR